MKTILITGSTDGIGKLTAEKLAKDGHEIILHGRNSEKLNQTIVEIKKATDNTKIQGFIADLSDFNSITKATEKLKEELSNIDVLINNAGVFKSTIAKNKNGLDMRFAVNYFAPYILTNQLLPLLEKSNEPRIINLSSAAQATISLKVLEGKEDLSVQEAYAQSKLALTIWSFHLAQNNKHLNVIAVNPGSLLNTKMVQEAYGQHWSSADKGADILHDLAIFEEYADCTGLYFDNDSGIFSKAHPDAYNKEIMNRLIVETNRILAI